MRTIKFRGKTLSNDRWVYGSYYEHLPPLQCIVPDDYIEEESKHFIVCTAFADWNMTRDAQFRQIDPHTVGQYTGLLDCTGKEIYEGDILQDDTGIGRVRWLQESCAFVVLTTDPSKYHFINSEWQLKYTEVIGNVYDNPELLLP